ncbi:MAG: DNA polymerase [Gammaproteobacteria bacterium]|nr:DNA polymerase [Gammaproteobacteria bacterium]
MLKCTVADIIKRAMIEIDAWLQGNETAARMIMQVHDELVFEVPQDEAGAFADQVTAIMCGAAELTVLLRVDIDTGGNWDEAH